jgi:hypothetical protein
MWYNYISAFVLFLMLIIVISYYLANYIAKKTYQAEYLNLKGDVSFAIINWENYKLIQQKFEDIHRFKCRDSKKLAELRTTFNDRFMILFTPDVEDFDEHSPDSIGYDKLQQYSDINKQIIANQNETE